MTEHAFLASDLEARGLHAGTITAVVRPIVPQPPDGFDSVLGVWFQSFHPFGQRLLWRWRNKEGEYWPKKGNWPCHPFGTPTDYLLKEPGDVLAVKETFRAENIMPATWSSAAIRFKADDAVRYIEFDEYALWDCCPRWWCSPARMPREFVRLRLTVQAVRAVRVQELAEADILALGIVPTWRRNDGRLHTYYDGWADDQAQAAFAPWWDARWGKRYPHDSNPWLWLGMVRNGAE
jgi:hypothetical protein